MWDLVSQACSVGIVTSMCFYLYLAMAINYDHIFLLVYVYLFFPPESEHENVCRPVFVCVGLTKSFVLYCTCIVRKRRPSILFMSTRTEIEACFQLTYSSVNHISFFIHCHGNNGTLIKFQGYQRQLNSLNLSHGSNGFWLVQTMASSMCAPTEQR